MLVVMKKGASKSDIGKVEEAIKRMGYTTRVIPGIQRIAIGVLGNKTRVDSSNIELMPEVLEVIHVTKPYKLVGREFKSENSIIRVNDIEIGGEKIIVIAGPCAVENREQILETAQLVKEAGVPILRGGAFKPRTSPYSFQGLGEEGLKLLAEAKEKTGLAIVTEVIDNESVDMAREYVDILQIGARNMQNFSLLKKVGNTDLPILLKRGLSATIVELLMAAEYIASEGNWNIILCERGIRTFADQTRNTLDLSAVPVIHELSHLPIIVDPSHGTGRWDRVIPSAAAAIAIGADGIIVEVHPRPEEALSDGVQSLKPEKFKILMDEVKKIAEVVNRDV